uniref:WAP domain-containing protein n=1 Tax=Panagrolaimus sp. PS1159 TaxID=55785 RepID=A0AC35EWE1_9BILA
MTLCEYYSNIGIYKPECHPLYLNTNNIYDEQGEDESLQYPQQQQQSFQYNFNEPERSAEQSSPFQFSFHHLPSIQFDNNRYKSAENSYYKSTESRYTSAENRYKSSENAITILPDYEEYSLCKGFYHMCYESDKCESGTICSQLRTTKQCCTAPGNQCPSPTELGFNCRKINPTSWCFSDNDCNSQHTHKMMCCATGCNYNICIPQNRAIPANVGFHNIARSAKMMSPDCPDPFSIHMHCHKSNPTSWCQTHNDCPSAQNALHPRRCCPTPCGYNACFIRFGGNWVIG